MLILNACGLQIRPSGMIIGAHFKTSYDPNKGHSISDFSGYISQLPEGHYEVINGKIVKR